MNYLIKATMALLFTLGLAVAGCEPYQPPSANHSGVPQVEGQQQPGPSVFQRSETECIVMIVIDLSGSFAHQMADEGKAYEFALRIYDQYFRDRIGNDKDVLIVSQLSGTHRSLLWRGSPLELRHKFSSSSEFRDFLLANADPNGSVIHDGIAHSLEYLSSDPALANGNARSAVFVLSDLLDNGVDPEKSGPRVSKALSDYARKNGVVGMYYVDQDLVLPWRQTLQAAGIRDYRVECIIDENPDLPSL